MSYEEHEWENYGMKLQLQDCDFDDWEPKLSMDEFQDKLNEFVEEQSDLIPCY